MLIDEFENLFQEATVSLPYKMPMPNNMSSRSGHTPDTRRTGQTASCRDKTADQLGKPWACRRTTSGNLPNRL